MLNLKALAGLVLICFAVLFFPPFLNALGPWFSLNVVKGDEIPAAPWLGQPLLLIFLLQRV